MVDAAALTQLTGKIVHAQQPTHYDLLSRAYRDWLQTDVAGMLEPSFDSEQDMKRKYRDAFAHAAEKLQHLQVQKEQVPPFISVMRESSAHPNYVYSGIFLSALIQRVGNGHYRLPDVSDLSYVGYGLEQCILETEKFGFGAGALQPALVCSTELPSSLPHTGIVLVGQQYGWATGFYAQYMHVFGGTFSSETGAYADTLNIKGGTFSTLAGKRAKRVRIDGGHFGAGTGESAKHIVLFGGEFGAYTADGAYTVDIHGGTYKDCVIPLKKLLIYGGTFGRGVGIQNKDGPDENRWCESVEYRGGDYEDRPWKMREELQKKFDRDVALRNANPITVETRVVGNITSYTKHGRKRWRIT